MHEAFPLDESEQRDDHIDADRPVIEGLMHKIHDAISILEFSGAEPDMVITDVKGIPFGRFADGRLDATLIADGGDFYGRLTYKPADSSDRSFDINRSVRDQAWMNGKSATTNQRIMRRLHADWPSFIVDNSAVLNHIDNPNPSMKDVHDIVQCLVPHAHPQDVLRTSAYGYHMVVADDDTMFDVPLTITKTTSLGEPWSWTVVASVTLPETLDGSLTDFTYCLSFDDQLRPNFSKTYIDLATGEIVPVYIDDLDYAINNQFSPMIDKLVDEKLYGNFSI